MYVYNSVVGIILSGCKYGGETYSDGDEWHPRLPGSAHLLEHCVTCTCQVRILNDINISTLMLLSCYMYIVYMYQW